MRFDALSLDDFKCYAETAVTFDPGVTVIHGVNGSGKSTLLDACFFALYGSDALVGTLDEVISTGQDASEIDLSLTHDGHAYEISRALRVSGDRAHTASCELDTPEGTISGARNVRTEIASLLRMDADAFLNCAYVRQGEVNKLIHASPAERQDMIDELLQLGVLETYRDRATQARRGVASLRDEYAGQLDAIDEQIDRKEAEELHATLNELETRRDTLDERIAQLADQMDEAEQTRSEAEEILDRFQERQTEVDELTEDIETLEETIAETAQEREACTDRIGELSDELTTIRERIDECTHDIDRTLGNRSAAESAYDELDTRDEELRNDIEETRIELQSHAQAAENASERATEQQERATELASEIEDRQHAIDDDARDVSERMDALESLRENRQSLEHDIAAAGFDDPTAVADAIDRVESDRSEGREREAELRSRVQTLREEIDEMEALIDAGQCPTCGQETCGAPAVDALDETQTQRADAESSLADVREERESAADELERLEAVETKVEELNRVVDRIASMEELIEEKQSRLAERRTDLESLESEQEAARDAALEAEDRAETERSSAETLRSRIAEINANRAEVRSRREAIEDVLDLYDSKADIQDEIESERERRRNLETLNDERRDRLSDKRDRRRELQEQVDADRIESAQASVQRSTEYLDRATEERESLQSERDDVIDRIGGVQNELRELRNLRERKDELAAERAAVDSVHEEVAALESLYGDLRGDLREQNLVALERMLNETFELVYQNDAYDRIELDREYRFTVYQKDGSTLDPSLLSGGERALFNLSLRCAIYRLLSEGIQGTAPLPPLILDEPTVYLDAGHVGRLVELVDAMRSLGVEQIILVTHDEELLRAADSILTVEKDPTTNRSSVSASAVGPGIPVQE